MKLKELVYEGTWSSPQTENKAKALVQLMKHPIPASTSTDALYDLIGDDQLFDQLERVKDSNPEMDIRPLVISKLAGWLRDNNDSWRNGWEPNAIKLIMSLTKLTPDKLGPPFKKWLNG